MMGTRSSDDDMYGIKVSYAEVRLGNMLLDANLEIEIMIFGIWIQLLVASI